MLNREVSATRILKNLLMAASFVFGIACSGCNQASETEPGDADNQAVAKTATIADLCAAEAVSANAASSTQLVICSETPSKLTAKHSPLYKAEAHTSTIKAVADNTDGSVSMITIHAMQGFITDCTERGVDPSVIPCRKDARILQPVTCPMKSLEHPAECAMTLNLSDGDMVTYVAIAALTSGTQLVTLAVTYAAGVPPVNVAVPVWLHTDLVDASLDAGRINVAFFMDPGLNGVVEFSSELSSVTRQAFFAKTKKFGQAYTRSRHFFDVWAYPFAGAKLDPASCTDFSDSAAELDGHMDGSAILHSTGNIDCSSLGPDGAGTVNISDTSKKGWLFVHESGHFLLGLGDEYGDGKQSPTSDPPNVYGDNVSCNAVKSAYSGAVCESIDDDAGPHRVVTEEPETMKSKLLTSDFRNTSAHAFRNRLTMCAGGHCYEEL